jgi:hypothetical protein
MRPLVLARLRQCFDALPIHFREGVLLYAKYAKGKPSILDLKGDPW